jgi:hypothetical protein
MLRHGHGRWGKTSPTYISWRNMHVRCSKPSDNSFRFYGAKGIKVCERWRDFTKFLADMGECPSGLTLDRLDNNKNYELGNCRWATKKEQARQNRRLAWFDGKAMSRREIAAHLEISPTLLNYRINKGHIVLQDV